jgi:hypothetical protein
MHGLFTYIATVLLLFFTGIDYLSKLNPGEIISGTLVAIQEHHCEINPLQAQQ